MHISSHDKPAIPDVVLSRLADVDHVDIQGPHGVLHQLHKQQNLFAQHGFQAGVHFRRFYVICGLRLVDLYNTYIYDMLPVFQVSIE